MRVLFAAAGLIAALIACALADDTLDPKRGSAIGTVVEAYLSPHQEPSEEKDTPRLVPSQFRSNPQDRSVLRTERKGFGRGRVRFTKDLSRAYVDLTVENIEPGRIVMFHIHCGPPDLLGPILVDFGMGGDLPAKFPGGRFSQEITNKIVADTADSGHGLLGFMLAGCPVYPSNPVLGKVRTVAGMEYIARLGDLYFNLHTRGHVFYGDLRGRLVLVGK